MNKQIGAKIKKLREKRHMTQGRLAEKAGIAQSTLSYIENGKKKPQFDTLSSICKGLEISIFELLSYDVLKTNKKFLEQQSLLAGKMDLESLGILKDIYEKNEQAHGPAC